MNGKYVLTVKGDRYQARYHYDTLAGAELRAKFEMDGDENRRAAIEREAFHRYLSPRNYYRSPQVSL